jgi:hypothetical protein
LTRRSYTLTTNSNASGSSDIGGIYRIGKGKGKGRHVAPLGHILSYRHVTPLGHILSYRHVAPLGHILSYRHVAPLGTHIIIIFEPIDLF